MALNSEYQNFVLLIAHRMKSTHAFVGATELNKNYLFQEFNLQTARTS